MYFLSTFGDQKELSTPVIIYFKKLHVYYLYCRGLLLWRSHHTETREYQTQFMLTSTYATARGRGANTSALPTCPPTVTILWMIFLHLYLPVTLKELYISHSALTIKSISPVLDLHQLEFTVAVKKLNFLKNCKPAIFLQVLVNAPGPAWARPSEVWVKAKNAGICLFCSLPAFLGNEVYLLTDRASERCWCREVSSHPLLPAPWLSHPTSHKCCLGSTTHQSVYKYTSTHTYVSQASLFLVGTWKVRNISRCVYHALWPSQCL